MSKILEAVTSTFDRLNRGGYVDLTLHDDQGDEVQIRVSGSPQCKKLFHALLLAIGHLESKELQRRAEMLAARLAKETALEETE